MMLINRLTALNPIILLVASCGYHIGAAQTRDEFKVQTKGGGFLTRDEHTTVSRPIKAVVADVKGYADKCLDVSVTTGPNYALREVGGTMLYHPKIDTSKEGVVTLSLQSESTRKSAMHGAPPDGVFMLVAEIRAADANTTRINFNYLNTANSAVEHLKQWANGDKNRCPKF